MQPRPTCRHAYRPVLLREAGRNIVELQCTKCEMKYRPTDIIPEGLSKRSKREEAGERLSEAFRRLLNPEALHAAELAAMEVNGNFAPHGEDRGTLEVAIHAYLAQDGWDEKTQVHVGGALPREQVEAVYRAAQDYWDELRIDPRSALSDDGRALVDGLVAFKKAVGDG